MVQDYMLNKRGPGTVATARLNRPVGADNQDVCLRYLGLGREQLRALKAEGVL